MYSTYGHVSEYTVPEGVRVNEGDMVGRVGHEGMAYGDHVHFVINTTPNNTYAFRECPDLAKGEIAIGNQGLCRDYMTTRTVDPIAWIESQGNINNINGVLANNNKPATPTATTNTTTTSGRRRMPLVPLAPSVPVKTPVTSTLTQKAISTTASTQKSLATRTISPNEVSKNEIAYAPVDSTKTSV